MKDTLINKTVKINPEVNIADSTKSELVKSYKEYIEYKKPQIQEKTMVSPDTIYAVRVTLFIFVLGIIVDRFLRFIDKKIKEYKLKKFFIFHLNQANTDLITKLKDAYKDFYEETNINTGITSTPPKVISGDFQRLININNEELFNAYRKKDVLSKILGYIEFVEKVQIEVENFHERVLIDSDKIREDLENQSDEYLGLLSKFIEKKNQNITEYPVTFDLINNLVIKYYTELSGTRQLSVFYSDIIRTIQEHLVNTGEYKTNEVLSEIAEKGRKLSHIITKLTQKTSEITEQYKVFSEYMDNANQALNNLMPELK